MSCQQFCGRTVTLVLPVGTAAAFAHACSRGTIALGGPVSVTADAAGASHSAAATARIEAPPQPRRPLARRFSRILGGSGGAHGNRSVVSPDLSMWRTTDADRHRTTR